MVKFVIKSSQVRGISGGYRASVLLINVAYIESSVIINPGDMAVSAAARMASLNSGELLVDLFCDLFL